MYILRHPQTYILQYWTEAWGQGWGWGWEGTGVWWGLGLEDERIVKVYCFLLHPKSVCSNVFSSELHQLTMMSLHLCVLLLYVSIGFR